VDRRVAEVLHRLLDIAEDLLACALSRETDLFGFARDHLRRHRGFTVLLVPAGELAEALKTPKAVFRRPVPVTRKEVAELLLRLSQDCRGSGRSPLPIAPNPEFMEEVEALLSRLPDDLFDRDNQD
jgi:hypothetical protein